MAESKLQTGDVFCILKPSWIIQNNMDGVDTQPMIDEVVNQGMRAVSIEHHLGDFINFTKYNPHDCIVCYGDIDFVRQIQHRAQFIPGVWCNFNNMKCSTYYAYFGEHLLNQQYIMMPVGDLLRRWDKLITYAPDQSWFLRPDSGAKPFTGYVVAPDEKHKIQTLVQSVGHETLVVVAPERRIPREWRFVICDRQVVAGCQYLPDERLNYTPASLRLAEKIASIEWQPDLCYTVDMAESDCDVHLLEINSFSCAGLYDCDMESIVRYASVAAEKEWKEYQ